MIIDLVKLNSGLEKQINVLENKTYEDLYLDKASNVKLKSLDVDGYINRNSIDSYNIYLDVKGTMIIPCSVTLKPVNYSFDFQINDNLEEILAEMNETFKKGQNSIDIFPIIWENILMEIPMKVVSDDSLNVNLKGEGWELITDSRNENNVNPELQKLKDLL